MRHQDWRRRLHPRRTDPVARWSDGALTNARVSDTIFGADCGGHYIADPHDAHPSRRSRVYRTLYGTRMALAEVNGLRLSRARGAGR